MPEIVDVEWRLDYVVRSKHGGRENYPQFIIYLKVTPQPLWICRTEPALERVILISVGLFDLQVKDRGLVRNIVFGANQEELEDLLGKVRDAVKQVDRLIAKENK